MARRVATPNALALAAAPLSTAPLPAYNVVMFFHVHVGPDHPLVLWMKTRPGRAVSAVVCCLLLTMLMLFCVRVGVRQFLLSRDPGRVTSDSVEARTFGGRETNTEVNTAVRYRFTVDGQTYHYRGPTGGEWCDVSRSAMDAAAAAGRIDVIYRPADPWNNAPASKERWLIAWAAGLTLVPTALALGAWVWVYRVAQDEVGRTITGVS